MSHFTYLTFILKQQLLALDLHFAGRFSRAIRHDINPFSMISVFVSALRVANFFIGMWWGEKKEEIHPWVERQKDP